MYPLHAPSPYPRRQLWMAAWSKEVGRSVLGRTILGEKVVLYRTESGEAVCMSGICPHRMYPLEKGRLVGDSLQCGYHGITFDASGVVPRCLPRTLPHRRHCAAIPCSSGRGTVGSGRASRKGLTRGSCRPWTRWACAMAGASKNRGRSVSMGATPC
jgi:vanillate O-demethylase monooxygenase subunit